MKRIFTILIISCLMLLQANAQSTVDTAIRAFIPNFAYSFQWPGGDVAETYGNNSTIGGGFFYKSESNFLVSLDANYIFGSSVKNPDQILSMVLNSQGYIIDGNGTYALYTLYERGFTLNLRFGKIIRVFNPNPNSGIMLMGGLGWLQHRMVIDNQHRTAPQISGDYAKGYDRLTGGLNLNQFVGYFYMGKRRAFNFYGGFEFIEGFTKSQRDYVFDLMKKDDGSKLDLYFGIKLGWMIPIYKRAPEKYYYY